MCFWITPACRGLHRQRPKADLFPDSKTHSMCCICNLIHQTNAEKVEQLKISCGTVLTFSMEQNKPNAQKIRYFVALQSGLVKATLYVFTDSQAQKSFRLEGCNKYFS